MKNKYIFYSLLISPLFVVFFPSCEEKNIPQEEIHEFDFFDVKDEVNFGYETDESDISFTTAKKWEAVFTDNQNDWCSIEPSSGDAGPSVVKIKVSKNVGDTIRKEKITIRSGNGVQVIRVIQDYVDKMSIVDEEISFPYTAERKTLTFSANKEWKIILLNAENDWCTVTPSTGESGNVTVTVRVTENLGTARTEHLLITVGKLTKKVVVRQDPAPSAILGITKGRYPIYAKNVSEIIQNDLGEGWVLASWEDLLTIEDPVALAKELGFFDGMCAKIIYDGKELYINPWTGQVTDYGYYIEYHQSTMPNDPLDAYGPFTVGIWNFNEIRYLCRYVGK